MLFVPVLTLAFVLACAVSSRAARARPSCGTVEIVHANGRPLVGALVTHHYDHPYAKTGPSGGESWHTGRDGRVCARRLLETGFLEVHAPLALGGWCAAHEIRRYRGSRRSADNPDGLTRVRLRMRWLRRASWRGRVVGPDGHPIAGAHVFARTVFPDGTECSSSPRQVWYETAANGTFQLERLPAGGVELLVEAEGYAKQAFTITVPGPLRDLAIDGGAAWSARLLDPDGAPIEACSMRLYHTRDLISTETRCGPQGFSFRNVQAGDYKLYVRVDQRSWSGDERVLMVPMHFSPGEQRRDDLRWPAGLEVSGVVVDEAGVPVAGAYLRTTSQDREKWAAEGAIETKSDEQGRFTFRHLAPGAWNLIAGRDLLFGSYLVVEAGTRDVRVVLPARGKR
jgi:hypothetical protein